jgi:hypothetical protein
LIPVIPPTSRTVPDTQSGEAAVKVIGPPLTPVSVHAI